MPSRLTDERAVAIAQEYCSNGFNKTLALKAIKKADGSQYYSESYCHALGHGLYDNVRVVRAIKAFQKPKEAISIANRTERQEFWTKMMTKEEANNADKLRASELLGKSECDFIEKTVNLNADIPTDPELYKSWLEKELARVRGSAEVIDSYAKSSAAIAERH